MKPEHSAAPSPGSTSSESATNASLHGLRRILFPELWPADLRAAVILSVATIAVYSVGWAAPIIERPATNWMPAKVLFEFGQRLGGQDTRPYHALTMALHLLSAVLLFGILRRILSRKGERDPFVPACLGALAWAVHPVLTEAVIASDRGGALLGGLFALAGFYGVACVAGSARPAVKRLAGGICAVGVGGWLLLTFIPGSSAEVNSRMFVTGVKLAFWPAPLIYDYGAPLAGFREASLYFPLAALGALVAFTATRIGTARSLFVFAIPIAALGVMARVRTMDYRSSLVLWRDTAAKAPANAHAHRELGRALMVAGLGREALAHFERALELSPDGSARSDLAMAFIQLGRPADAITQYEQILQAEPRNASAQLEIAAALTALGRGADADRHYQSAMAFGISAADYHRRRGQALAEAGEFDVAQAELESALHAEPKSVETQVVLGMVLSAMGRPAEGMKHFVAAVGLSPEDAGAQMALGDALLEELRPSEALPHFETALRLDPARAALIHASVGRALVRLGRAKEAIVHLAAALELNPENGEAQADLELIRKAVQRHEDKK